MHMIPIDGTRIDKHLLAHRYLVKISGYSRQQLIATSRSADWFNNRRLLEPIGNVPPAEFEQAYYRQLEESAMAA